MIRRELEGWEHHVLGIRPLARVIPARVHQFKVPRCIQYEVLRVPVDVDIGIPFIKSHGLVELRDDAGLDVRDALVRDPAADAADVRLHALHDFEQYQLKGQKKCFLTVIGF